MHSTHTYHTGVIHMSHKQSALVSITIKVPAEVRAILQSYADEDMRTVSNWLSVHVLALAKSRQPSHTHTTPVVQQADKDAPWSGEW
jgi:hypothetical protein